MILYVPDGSLLILELSIILLEFCLSLVLKIGVDLHELLEYIFQVGLIFLSWWVVWMFGCTLVPIVLTGDGVISVPQNISVGIEIVSLSIHIVNLFFRGKTCSTLSITMVALTKVTSHDLGRRSIANYSQLLLDSSILYR